MTDKVLGVGIIGCGNISTTYLQLAPLFRNIEVRAVDRHQHARPPKRAARQFGVRAQSGAEHCWRNPAVQIVVNLTVPAVHYKVSRSSACWRASTSIPRSRSRSRMAEARDLQKTAAKHEAARGGGAGHISGRFAPVDPQARG
jgi:hypothetical protein